MSILSIDLHSSKSTVYIDAILLNLDPNIVRSEPRLHSTCSKQHGGNASSSADEKKIRYFISIQKFHIISKF
jgi:hypothetical protein